MNTRRDYEKAKRLVARYRKLVARVDVAYGLGHASATMRLMIERNDKLRALGYLLSDNGRVLSTRRFRIQVDTDPVRVRVVRR